MSCLFVLFSIPNDLITIHKSTNNLYFLHLCKLNRFLLHFNLKQTFSINAVSFIYLTFSVFTNTIIYLFYTAH